jgi:glutamyl/glutaminyl-tRNA synthetase
MRMLASLAARTSHSHKHALTQSIYLSIFIISQAINDFCERIGITRNANLIDYALLEQCCRLHLDETSPRALVVIDPLRVVLTNYDEKKVETFQVPLLSVSCSLAHAFRSFPHFLLLSLSLLQVHL